MENKDSYTPHEVKEILAAYAEGIKDSEFRKQYHPGSTAEHALINRSLRHFSRIPSNVHTHDIDRAVGGLSTLLLSGTEEVSHSLN